MIRVNAVQPEQRCTAVSMLVDRFPPTARAEYVREIIEANEAGELNLDGLLMAEVAGEAVGACLMILQPDGTAFVWPPVASSRRRDRAEIVDALLGELARQIDAADAWIGQCLLECDELESRAALSRNQFPHLTDLLFLKRPLDQELPDPQIRFETVAYDPSRNETRFQDMLQDTYLETCDCPELNGRRTPAEALASHRLAGEFSAARWKIYRAGGNDVGILLLSAQPAQNAWEIVYVGVAREARGQGFGRAIVLSGLHEAQRANAASMLLAVDCRNHFARKLYDELGFQNVARRSVHARFRQVSPPAK